MACRAYERSRGWKAAMALVTHVYRLTQDYPPEEKSGLAGSMRKAITTLPVKAAEAYEQHDYTKARSALDAADATLRDVLVQAQVSQILHILKPKQVADLAKRIDATTITLEQMLDELFEEDDELPATGAAA